MFVPMASYEGPKIETPSSSKAPMAIAIASIIFTIVTTVVFVFALFCNKCKKFYSSSKVVCWRCLRRDTKKGSHSLLS